MLVQHPEVDLDIQGPINGYTPCTTRSGMASSSVRKSCRPCENSVRSLSNANFKRIFAGSGRSESEKLHKIALCEAILTAIASFRTVCLVNAAASLTLRGHDGKLPLDIAAEVCGASYIANLIRSKSFAAGASGG
jgi:hypothetical protein